MKNPLHIPLQSAVAIASERRAVGAMLTARHALFCSNFSKIHDFQQVGKNDRGKFVQNAQILQSIAIDCPLENGYLCQFPWNCHKKRAVFERTPSLHFGVKEVITLFDIIQEWWEKEVKTVFDGGEMLNNTQMLKIITEIFGYSTNV